MIILVIYSVLLIAIASFDFTKNKNFDDYVLAGRSKGIILIGVSLMASTIGGASTVGLVKKVYNVGFPAIWFLAVGGFAHLASALLLSEKVRKSEARTLPDLAEKTLGKKARYLVSVIIVITWVGIIAAQLIAANGMVTGLLGFKNPLTLYITSAVIILYSLLGGQASVLKTDLLQFLILVISLIIALGFLLAAEPLKSFPIQLVNAKFKPVDLIYYLTVVSGSYLIGPMIFSRLLSSRTSKTAVKSSLISGIGILLFALLITTIGLWAKQNNPAYEGDLFTGLIMSYVPRSVGIIMTLGILSAIVSTADTALLTTASIVEHDLLGKSRMNMTRIIVVIIGVAGVLSARKGFDIIGTLLEAFAIYTAGIVPALFVGIMFLGKRKLNGNMAAFAVVTGGIFGLLAKFMQMRFLSLAGIILALILAFISAWMGSKIEKEV